MHAKVCLSLLLYCGCFDLLSRSVSASWSDCIMPLVLGIGEIQCSCACGHITTGICVRGTGHLQALPL